MVQKTVQVNVSSSLTDVDGVREQIRRHTSDNELEAVYELFVPMLRGETVSAELIETYSGELPRYVMDISVGGDEERVKTWLREAESDFHAARKTKPEFVNAMTKMFQYFYQYPGCDDAVSFEEMVEFQERTIENGDTMTAVMPV
jgi:hypothetical protein